MGDSARKYTSFGKAVRANALKLPGKIDERDEEEEELRKIIRKQMGLPEVVIEPRLESTAYLNLSSDPSSNQGPSVSMEDTLSSPKFIVDPVSSRKNSEDQKERMSTTDTKDGSQLDHEETKPEVSTERNGGVASDEGTSVDAGLNKEDKSVPDKDAAWVKKISEASGGSGTSSIPKFRKVSFYNDPSSEPGSIDGRHYPGHLLMPPHVARKISTDSFYQPPSRKTSMDAFYYPPPIPRHKISVFSIQSTDSDQTFVDTHEALPHPDFYREASDAHDPRHRPTLFELRDLDLLSEPRSPSSPGSVQSDLLTHELVNEGDEEKGGDNPAVTKGLKFGWITGVLVRCLLNIFGVMLFLRLTWVTGQAGIGLATVVILLSSVVTTLTTMSMSAICTNGEVKGGGAYYMISRSLGPEFGGSIGVIFALANAIAAAMYIVGFAETVRDIMWEHSTFITGDSLNDVRIIGVATCFLCLGIVLIGMEWEAKAQLVLLFILTVAIINFFIGTFIPPADDAAWKGVAGYKAEVFADNFGPNFRDGQSFFSVFSIFFPAATGILAGANMSGDLKDPQKAIPKGTFLAIIITGVVYIVMAWAAGCCIVRDALGPLGAAIAVNTTGNMTTIYLAPTLEAVSECSRLEEGCEYGLMNDNGAVGLASAFRPLIMAGIFSATLSSALASLVGAPKVFQALCKDRLFPFIKVFAKGDGPNQEPRRGYVLAFVICVAMTCVGSLDIIAPIISNFFLMAYALINYSCFDASLANSPGFRPAFKYYNKWFSLLGALLCLVVMFLVNWWAALVTFVIVVCLYMFIKTKKPDVNWGSSTQANAYREALKSTLKLTSVDEHVKNFRPQILVLTGFPRNRMSLVDFAASITKRQSLLICGHVFQGDLSEHVKRVRSTAAYRWFKTRKVKSFYNSVAAPTFRIGVQVLLQALGLGKMRPNTLLLGFKTDWQKSDPREVYDYYNIIQDAFDLYFGVGILRVPEGFDRNKVPDELLDLPEEDIYDSEEEEEPGSEDEHDAKVNGVSETNSTKNEKSPSSVTKVNENSSSSPSNGNRRSGAVNTSSDGVRQLRRLNTLTEGMENAAYEEDQKDCTLKPPLSPSTSVSPESSRRFKEVQFGTIDVWWLFDDGGLTLLVPYILSQRKQWKNCNLRVFCVGTKQDKVDEDQVRMATLLSKFRINYTQLTVITDLTKKPNINTYREFESMIHNWRLRSGEFQEDYMWKIADADLIAHKQKTYRHLRLRQQLKKHSMEASLIVMTLPVPRRLMCPAGLYMGWLEMLTKDMPPMLLLRGNQQSVLTYYS